LDQLVAVSDIEGSFVPTPRDDVVQLEVGAELVLMRGNQTFALNPSASLVWRCFDGTGDLDEVAADLADALGADAEVVHTDVLNVARDLASMGMLAGAAGAEAVDSRESDSTAVQTVEVGDELEAFTLPSLEGPLIEWSSFRGHRVLLVNWNPGCGFCEVIAGELGRLQPRLEEEGVTLVLVTRGDGDANRLLMAEHGIKAPALMRQDGCDPFSGFGTPAAYLVGADGRVAAPFAHGAVEVPLLVRQAAGVADTTRFSGQDGPRYLPSAAAVCNGDNRAPAGPLTAWAGTRAYALGPYHVGIRHNGQTAADLLDQLFSGQGVDDPRTPDNYSVAVYPPRRHRQELNLLVKDGGVLVRSRSRERVLRGLLAYLSAELTPPSDQSLLFVRARAAIHDGEAILLPRGSAGWTSQLQASLTRSGIQMVDLPLVTLDPGAAELVIPEPTIEHDPSVLATVDVAVQLGSEFPPVRPGRYPLRLWVVAAARGHEGATGGARSVLAAASQMWVTPVDRTLSVLTDIARLVERVPPVGMYLQAAATLAEQVKAELS
jgi:peroxiredoxin